MDGRLFVVLAAVCVVTYIARDVYQVLKDRQILQVKGIVFQVMFFNMVLLWVSWCLLCALDPSKVGFPNTVRYAGMALFASGVMLFVVGLLTLRTLESDDNDLVTTGIYSRIRHPMYLAFTLWLIGLPLVFGGVFSFVLAPVFIANVVLWRNIEERQLEQRFVAYREYKRATLF